MTATAEPTRATGRPKQVGRYTADGAERRLVAHRVDGIVQLRDEPVGAGRKHLVEPELTSMAELKAIVADYVALAECIDAIPMAEVWW